MRGLKIFLLSLLALGILIALVLFTKSHTIAVLEPQGVIAWHEKNLIITATALMLLVVIPVFVFTYIFVKRYRADNPKGKYQQDFEQNKLIEASWWALPCIIIAILSVLTWKSSHQLDPFKPIESNVKPVCIQVVALQWKWLFLYPEEGIACVNFVHFPENTPINFEITADAPMNSFWIPQLGGQVYAMAGMRTKLHLMASKVGNYRGCSANLSGKGFAGMNFIAKASSEQEFATWIQNNKGQNILSFNEYQNLAKPSENNKSAIYRLEDKNLFDRIVMACLEN